MRTYLTFEDDKSSKFWEVETDGKTLTTRWGRIGTNGQTKTKTLSDSAAAEAEAKKLIAKKAKKGYVESADDPGASTQDEGEKTQELGKVEAQPTEAEEEDANDGWVSLGDGSALTIRDDKLVARNKKGRELKSVSKKMKESEVGLQLTDILRMVKEHRLRCLETVERFMLRSLPIPRALLITVWPDATWRELLENSVVMPAEGDPDEKTGFLKDIDETKGIGVVNLDGESVYLDSDTVLMPHPILIEDLADFRELAAELGLEQTLEQLMRETFKKPDKLSGNYIKDYSDGEFEMLMQATGRARAIGCKVSGGYATTSVWEDAKLHKANYWIGAEDPHYETITEDLHFELDGKILPLSDVPAVTYSEGVRMASLIYASRKIEEEKKEEGQ